MHPIMAITLHEEQQEQHAEQHNKHPEHNSEHAPLTVSSGFTSSCVACDSSFVVGCVSITD